MSESTERGFGQLGNSPTLGRGWGLAEGIFVKNKGDEEFSYIFDWSANGFQQTTPQKPCLNYFPFLVTTGVAYYE